MENTVLNDVPTSRVPVLKVTVFAYPYLVNGRQEFAHSFRRLPGSQAAFILSVPCGRFVGAEHDGPLTLVVSQLMGRSRCYYAEQALRMAQDRFQNSGITCRPY